MFTTLQDAIDDAGTMAGHTLVLNNSFSEDLVSVSKAVIIDGDGYTLTSTSPTWGLSIPGAANVAIQDLIVDDAGTFGIHADCNSDALTISGVTVMNSGGTGIALNGSDNLMLTNVTATNNGGNGISITNCNNVTINGVTTSGNTFGTFSAGIGIFTSAVFCLPAASSNISVTGVVNISEPVALYESAGTGTITGTNVSAASLTHFAGIAGTDKFYASSLAGAYAFAAAVIDAGAPATSVHVEEVVSGNKFVNDDIPNPTAPPATIGLSINAAITYAQAGKTVFIEDGTYNERVLVTKSITLDGESEAGTILDGTGLGSSGSGIAISNNVTNVTIQDLIVRNYASSSSNDAGIAAQLSNNDLIVQRVTIHDNTGGRGGLYANGPINNVLFDDVTSYNHLSGARGIVIWNGLKSNITITNCTVFNNNCCGIELQDGSASGVNMSGNMVYDNGDSGMSAVGLNGSVGANTISGNTLTDNGRFGIEIKNPNGATTVSGNNVTLTAPVADVRDLAGIAIMRRGVLAGNVDVPTGVTMTGNTVSGYTQSSTSEGFGIVVEGTNHTVTGNTVSGNDVGLQQQQNDSGYPGDADQSNMADMFFGRANSPITCGNTISGNDVATRDVGGPFGSSSVTNTNTSEAFCSIQAAIDATNTINGHTLEVHSGTFMENVDATTKDIVLSPGSSPGQVTIDGDLSLDAGDALLMEVNGASPGSQHDQFVVTGSVDITGVDLDLVLGYVPLGSDEIVLIDASEAVTGMFAQTNSITVGGYTFTINYGGGIDGFDVVLSLNCGTSCGPTTFTGNVTLNTQAQVDAFVAAGNCKYTEITGSLTIDGNGTPDGTLDPITSLCTLTDLDLVGGNVIIRDFDDPLNLTTLVELSNLREVAGSLTIGGSTGNANPQFVEIELVALELVGSGGAGSLNITHNPNVVPIEIVQLSLVSTNVNISNNGGLASVVLGNGLATIGQNLVIQNNNAAPLQVLDLRVQSVGGNLTLDNNNTGTGAMIMLPNLVNVGNNATISDIAQSIATPSGLTVGNNLNITNNDFLCNANLSGLQAVGGFFSFTNNFDPGCSGSSVDFSGLQTVGNYLVISGNDDMPSLNFAALTAVNGASGGANPRSIDITNNDNQMQQILLPVLNTGTISEFRINGNANLENIAAPMLPSVGEDFRLEDNNLVNNIDFGALQSVAQLINIDDEDALLDLNGFGMLNTVNQLTINGNNALTQLSSLGMITATVGTLNITNNPALSDLTGLANLTSVGGDMAFTNNDAVTTLDGPTGFAALDVVTGTFSATGNALLANCCVVPCRVEDPNNLGFTDGGGVITISGNNGPGQCTTLPEAQTACSVQFVSCPSNITIEGCTPDDITLSSSLPFHDIPSNPATITEQEFATEGGSLSAGCGLVSIVYWDEVTASPCPIVVNRTFLATDENGVETTCIQVLTVEDQTLPTITCPAPVTVTCSTDVPAFAIGSVTATDNCGAVTVTFTGDQISNQICANQYLVEREYTATDACDNTTTCVQLITVDDQIPPSITCPAPVTVTCSTDVPAFAIGSVTATDNCGGATVTFTGDQISSQICANQYLVEREYTATDACDNTTTCVQLITVDDQIPPTISCPPAPQSPTEWPAGFNIEPVGANTPQDASIDPSITGEPDNAQDNCTPAAQIQIDYQDEIEFLGPCSGPSAIVWRVTRTWTISDDCGNSTTCVQVFEYFDTTPPVIVCPPALTASCSIDEQQPYGDFSEFENAGGSATDNCALDASSFTYGGDVTDNNTCPETITRFYRVSDDCGNSASCSQTITINDQNTPPSLSCPPAIGPICTVGDAPPYANYNAFSTAGGTADDNCAIDPGSFSFVDDATDEGNCPEIITRTYSIEDLCGSTAFCTQEITINDLEKPEIICPQQISAVCDINEQPEYADFAAFQSAGGSASDNCGINPASFEKSGEISDDMTCPETITRTYYIEDNCSNFAICTQIIVVDDEIEPTLNCPPALAANCDINEQPAYANFNDFETAGGTADDNCAVDEGSFQLINTVSDMGSCPEIVTRTYQIADLCGNLTTCEQRTVINDIELPELICPGGLTAVCDINETPAYATLTEFENDGGSADDNCGIDAPTFFLLSENSDGNTCPEVVTRTYQISDLCGNNNTCEQTITVDDEVAPTLVCPADLSTSCSITDLPAYATLSLFVVAGGSATDNCAIDEQSFFLLSENSDAGSCPETVTRTYSVADLCGNVMTCIQGIEIDDDEVPVLVCPQPLTAVCDINEQVPYADYAAFESAGGSATDNCGINAASFTSTGETSDNATCPETIIRTYSIEDICGNSAVCEQTIVVDDEVAPTLNCPPALTANCDIDEQPAYANFNDFVTAGGSADDNCAVDEGSFLLLTEVSDNGSCPEIVTRTYQIADLCGNLTTCEQRVIINDEETPTLIGADCSSLDQSDLDQCLSVANAFDPTTLEATVAALYEDNCTVNLTATYTTTDAPTSNSDCDWTLIYNFTIEDDCGNSVSCSVKYGGGDAEAPSFTIPINVVGNDGAQCGDEDDLNNTGFPTDLTDNCLDDEASAASGYTAGATSWTTAAGYMISFTDVITDPHPSGDCSLTGNGLYSRKYRIDRTFVVEDACGNSAVNTQLINIVDNTPPELAGCPQDVTVECDAVPDPPVIGTDITATDNCDDASLITIVLVETSTPGACPDAYILTREWTATDKCGYSSTCTQEIRVQDTTNPTWDVTMPGDVTVECDAVPIAGTFTASDNCDDDVDVEFVENSTPGNCPDSYTLTRTWTATDNCGLSIVHTQTITVSDMTPPEITCPASITIECDESLDPNVNETLGFAEATDNCGETAIDYADENLPGNCPDDQIVIRTWTALDDCGNNAQCTQVITVDDSTVPELTCPPNITIDCTASSEPANTGSATATDNCDTAPTVGHSDVVVPGICPQERVITRTWVAADNCGNTTTCSQTIRVDDSTPPTINCPSVVTVECDESLDPTVNQNLGSATAEDDCSSPTEVIVTYDDALQTGACPQDGLVLRTWTAEDACGNATTCMQVITVEDNTAPDLVCPANVTVECDESTDPGPNTPTGEATATDNCDPGPLTISSSDAETPGNCPQEKTITRTWSTADACGNSTSCVQVITVDDSTAPEITCPANTTVNCQDDNTSAATGVATATDNCDASVDIDESDEIVPGNCVDSYTILRTWTAVDDCGNASACEQTIIVQDIEAPTINCPISVTVNCQDDTTPAATGIATATDNCAVDVVPTSADEIIPGPCPDTYTIERTWTAVDNCDNSTICLQIIEVQDIEAPVIDCPASVTVNCEDDTTPTAAGTGFATATDNCDLQIDVTSDDERILGPCPDTYTIERTWTAVDNCDNSTICLQIIEVQDVDAPTIECPNAVTVNCQDDTTPAATGIATATDNCDLQVDVTSADETVPGPCPDTYTIERTWTAVDNCDNSTTCLQIIEVQDIEAPEITCPADVTINCEDDETSANTGVATATDNCDTDITITESDFIIAGNCPESYTIERTWEATDNCENVANCLQKITVQDIEAPEITCPADVTINCEDDPTPAGTGFATATDNCDMDVTVTAVDELVPGNCPENGAIERTWTAVDNCGNSISCLQTISIIDETDPVITCPSDVIISCETDPSPATTGTATATDNCDNDIVIVFTDTDTPGACDFEKTISRRWVAVDDCNNVAVCVQTITIVDETAPEITCPDNVTVECDADTSPANTGIATATDNCDPQPIIDFSDATVVDILCTQTYVITRTWTAKDACGNETICEQTINVEDSTPPVLTCPGPVTVECDEDRTPGANNPTGIAVAADNCDLTPTVLLDDEVIVSGACPQEMTITRTWVAIDDCSNATACTQTIVVEDNTPPVLECPADATVECDQDPLPALTGTPTATDNCDMGPFVFESTDAEIPGNCPQERTITRTWRTSDACGNAGTCVQTVTVDDSTPPEITCPANVTIECDEDSSPLNTGAATAIDNCDPEPGIDFSDATTPGTCPQEMTITRTWFTIDACGNETTCIQTITVVDTQAPTFDPGCQKDPVQLTTSANAECPANAGTSLAVGQMITASDTWTVAGIAQNSIGDCVEDNCADLADIIITVESIDVDDANLPCERTITIAFELSDPCGNINPELITCIYVINDDIAPTFTVPAEVTISCEDDVEDLGLTGDVTDEADNCQINLDATYSDNLSGLTDCNGTGTIERTWMLDDGCGNSLLQTQTIRVIDDTNPIITCPKDTVINCEVDPITANTGEATATDNCDMEVIPTFADVVAPGNCPDRRTITRTWTAIDDCNNTTFCEQIITVQDTTKPTIICPANITINCDDDPTPANTGTAAATDNCDASPSITFLDTNTPGGCPNEQTITRRWLALDNCLNAAVCIQQITVEDNAAPVLTCPDPVTIECDEDQSPANTGEPEVSDACDANPVVDFEDLPSSLDPNCLENILIIRTWTAKDACGNSTICVQQIVVDDTTMPVITCPASVTVECDQSLDPGPNTPTGVAIAVDNCDPAPGITHVDNATPGTCPQEQVISRVWAAIDACGNVAVCEQMITVEDNTSPVLTCPADATVECDQDPMPALTGTPTAVDNCDPGPFVFESIDDEVPGNCPQERMITRTWSTADACGNVGTCVQTVTVDDSTPPVITCPANVTIECDEDSSPDNTGTATATDNCDEEPLQIEFADAEEDGTCPQEKTILRTWTATDACGNSTTCVQTITVEDTTAPKIDGACDLLTQFGNGSDAANYTVGTSNGADCPAVAELNLTISQEIAADYEITVGGIAVPGLSGCFTDNCADPADLLARVVDIVESGDACNKFFEIHFAIVDPCGNVSLEEIVYTLEVIDDEAPATPAAPADENYQCESEVPAPGPLTAVDNCAGDITVTGVDSNNEGAGCVNDPFIITRTWTFDDGCGNTSMVSQTITVVDDTNPEIDCPADVTIECDADTSPANTGEPTVSDNCSSEPSVDFVDTVVPSQCPNTRIISRMWVVVDDCGNSTTCVQRIVIEDTTPPVIACPADITLNCDDDLSPANTGGSATAIDNCDPTPSITFTDESAPGNCPQERIITRTWFAFDSCGNVAVCDQFINIIDAVAPAIACPADTVINCEIDPIPANTGMATAEDNCDLQPTISFADVSVTDPDCPQGRKITRTWTAEDACGNSTMCEQTITVQDTTKPLIICPSNITVECDASLDPTVNTDLGTAAVQDNCDLMPVLTFTDIVTPGSCQFGKVIRRTWLASDHCDNATLCVQVITVEDSTPPMLECPADTVINCNTDTSPAATGFATATDNCGMATTPTFDDEVTPGNCPQESTITRTWTSEDECGNTGLCVQIITVQDTIKPSFTVPADTTIYSDANCQYDAGIAVTGDVTDEEDNCAVDLEATFTDVTADGQCAGNKVITRTWSLNDGCDNVLTQNQIIIVLDTLVPTFPKPADITLTTEDGASCPEVASISLVVDQTNPVASGNAPFTFTVHDVEVDGPTVYSDNCSSGDDLTLIVWNIIEDFGNTADDCRRQIRVVFRAYDDCGNFQQRQQTFTIVDNTAPKFNVPADITLSCEEDASDLTLTGDVTDEFDNCHTGLEATYSDDLSGLTNCNGTGILLRTWTLEDGCGNSLEQTQTIRVIDDTNPVITCPKDTVINCEVPLIPANTGMATATDNCDPEPAVTFDDEVSPGQCPEAQIITRTWTAVDACDNSAICVQIITVQDTTRPVITCPVAVTIDCDVSLDPAVNLDLGVAISVDNCDLEPGVDYTDFNLPGGDCPQARVILRTWLTVDNCNNAAACSQMITVTDQTAPTIECPADATVNCDGDYSIAALGSATATDNCDPAPVISSTETSAPGACPQAQIITRTWMAVDACGNSTSCVQTIMVQDTTRPVIVCPQTVTVQCEESINPSENPNVGTLTATDNCDPELVIDFIDTDLGLVGCTRTILRNWIAADDCNNAAACTQIITITDSEPPVWTFVPESVQLECDGVAPPYEPATAEDDCDNDITVTYEGEVSEPGACPGSTVITRTWSTEDDCGNSTSTQQVITIQDSQPPVWTSPLPADLTLDCTEMIPDPDMLTVEDFCDTEPSITFVETRIPGPCPQTDTLTRTWTAMDNCGNATTHVQVIIISDDKAPQIECPADLTLEWIAGFNIEPVDPDVPQDPSVDPFNPIPGTPGTGLPQANDDCGDPKITFQDVLFGPNPDNCPELWVLERTWTAEDACGNSTSCVQTITFTDTTPPQIDCPADLTFEWIAGFNIEPVDPNVPQDPSVDPFNPIPGTPGTGMPQASDNCGDPEITFQDVLFGPNPDACPNLWVLERTWTAKDACGLTTTCVQKITFTDTTPPQIDCPADLTMEWVAGFNIEPVDPNVPQDPSVDPVGSPTGPNGTGVPQANDNCGDPQISFQDMLFGPNPDNCPELWVLERTWTAKDACGLTSTCVQTITFTDTTPPQIDCPADLTMEWPTGFNTQLVPPNVPQDPSVDPVGSPTGPNGTGVPQVTDNCGNPQVMFVDILFGPNPNNCPQLWVLERTWIATDACGLTATCVQTITFTDLTPPMLTCPADTVINCEVDPAPANTGMATATDNCGTPTVTFSDDEDPGACPQAKVIKRTWTAVDFCGNSTNCVQFITVQDTTPPSFTAPADITLYSDTLCLVSLTNLGDVTDESDNCSTDLDATFADDFQPGPGGTERTIIRTWMLTDDCGNSTIQTQTIAIRDTIAPTFVCPMDGVVSPNTDTCTYGVPGVEFDPTMLKDNCGIDTATFELSGATTGNGGNTLQGTALNVGNTIVTWKVLDVNGNAATCTMIIRVNLCAAITGTIIWEGNDADTVGVAEVTVTLTGDDNVVDGPTPASGDYSLTTSMGTNFVITPTKPGTLTTIPIDPLNGVTGDDALAILYHVYGFALITDPYKQIAADVNMSGVITRDDEVLIRRALLGSEPALEIFRNKPWIFVPDTTDTPVSMGYHPAANPLLAPIPTTRILTGVTAGAMDQNFYGIKLGDVNATANPLLHPVPVDPLVFRVQDEHLQTGETVTVIFRASNFQNLTLFQEALFADPAYLELKSVETSWSPIGITVDDNFGLSLAPEGEIRTLWLHTDGHSIADNTPVFALTFKVLQGDRKLSEVLRLKPKTMTPMAITADQARTSLELVFDEVQTTATADPTAIDKRIELLQNRPNPFTQYTAIGFVLPEACTAQLRVLDIMGRELLRIDDNYPAGYNEQIIQLRDIGATGILYYELTTPYGKLTRKMKAVSP